jgi:cysteine synthase B
MPLLHCRSNGSSRLDDIGITPLLRLASLSSLYPGVQIFAKTQCLYPGGFIKDRPGSNMILDGERTGPLTKSHIILDATSRNTGIAYAIFGVALGYKVLLFLPQNTSPERKAILNAYRASLILTDSRADPKRNRDSRCIAFSTTVSRSPMIRFFNCLVVSFVRCSSSSRTFSLGGFVVAWSGSFPVSIR